MSKQWYYLSSVSRYGLCWPLWPLHKCQGHRIHFRDMGTHSQWQGDHRNDGQQKGQIQVQVWYSSHFKSLPFTRLRWLEIKLVTFQRGVQDLTLTQPGSCGSHFNSLSYLNLWTPRWSFTSSPCWLLVKGRRKSWTQDQVIDFCQQRTKHSFHRGSIPVATRMNQIICGSHTHTLLPNRRSNKWLQDSRAKCI